VPQETREKDQPNAVDVKKTGPSQSAVKLLSKARALLFLLSAACCRPSVFQPLYRIKESA
ncbi:MAG: hypothetical protein KC897_12575, partial [Candidatus Omnitrophica bacterium]|nr:hypothetical protein [Candidatus Omnitrophota bacterium]